MAKILVLHELVSAGTAMLLVRAQILKGAEMNATCAKCGEVLDDRIAELEAIVRSQNTMLNEIAEAAGFKRGDTYSASSIIAALKKS